MVIPNFTRQPGRVESFAECGCVEDSRITLEVATEYGWTTETRQLSTERVSR
jgi:hypothetical protein